MDCSTVCHAKKRLGKSADGVTPAIQRARKITYGRKTTIRIDIGTKNIGTVLGHALQLIQCGNGRTLDDGMGNIARLSFSAQLSHSYDGMFLFIVNRESHTGRGGLLRPIIY